MRRNLIETIMAAVVLVVAGAFVVFTLDQTTRSSSGSYDIKASFLQTPGLLEGAGVQIAGVPVGYVSRVAVDPVTFDVEVRMEIDEAVAIPVDSRASLTEDGALGETQVQIHRGSAAATLRKGDFVADTQSPVNLIDQIGRFIYGSDI